MCLTAVVGLDLINRVKLIPILDKLVIILSTNMVVWAGKLCFGECIIDISLQYCQEGLLVVSLCMAKPCSDTVNNESCLLS